MFNNAIFASPSRQYFPFPFEVINYILKNPLTSNGLHKLYQTCKYFFSKWPVLILMDYASCSIINNKLQCISGCSFVVDNSQMMLWLNGKIIISDMIPHKLNKVYRCTSISLDISSSKLTVAEFILLTRENKTKIFKFHNSLILYSDGTNVQIDFILKNLPNVIDFEYGCRIETYDTKILCNLLQLKRPIKFHRLALWILPVADNADINLLLNFIKHNTNCASKVFLYFTIYNSAATRDAFKNAVLNFNSEKSNKNEKPIIHII